MDNGSFFFVLIGGPLVIVVIGGAMAVLFAVAVAINSITGAAVRGVIELIRSRRGTGTSQEQEAEPAVGDHL